MKLKLCLQILILSFFSYMLHASTNSYVCNYGTDTVSNIDIATNTVVTTISVGRGPSEIAITPDATQVYVCNQNSNNVSVIDTDTNTVSATIPVGSYPLSIAIMPNGTYLYVCNQISNDVSVIDTSTNTVIATISVGSTPWTVVISPDGTKAYVANGVSNNVSVIDTGTNTVSVTISVGSDPFAIGITPDGAKVYVCNINSNNVTVINARTNAIITTILVGSEPDVIGITPDGSKAYVVSSSSNNVSVINTSTNTVSATISVDSGQKSLAIIPDGSKVYLCNFFSNTVSVINTSNNTVSATIPVGSNPAFIAITSDGSKAYVANSSDNNVSVINTVNNTVSATIPVGSNPSAIIMGTLPQIPTANSQSLNAVQNEGASITLTGAHNGGTGSFTFAQASAPSHGVVTGFPSGNVTYTSNATFVGQDTFTFTVTDTAGTSTAATVYINVLPSSQRAYVTTYDGTNGHVGIITDVQAVPVFSGSVGGMSNIVSSATGFGVAPDGTQAYVSYGQDNKIIVIDTNSNSVTHIITDNASPLGLALSPDNSIAYIYNDNTNDISIFNTATNNITGVVNDSNHDINSPVAIAFTPDGSSAYFACNAISGGSLVAVDATINSVIGPVSGISLASFELNGVAISPDGNFVYVVSSGNASGGGAGGVYIVDSNPNSLTYNQVVGNIDDRSYSFNQPFFMAIAPNGSVGYVINADNTITIVDLSSGAGFQTTIGSLSDASFTSLVFLAFTSDSLQVYAVNNTGLISIIKVSSGLVDALSVLPGPFFIGFLGASSASAPTANSQSQTFGANSSNNAITLTGTHNGGTGSFTFTQVAGPLHGTLSGLPNTSGAVTYTPTHGYAGSDSFTFTVTDTAGTSSPAHVTITVENVIANMQAASCVENVAQNLKLTASGGIAPYTFAIASNPSHGTLSAFNASGTVTYTPSATYLGLDSFTFTARDSLGISSSAGTFSLNVFAPSTRAYITDSSGSTSIIDIINVSRSSASGTVAQSPSYGAASAIALTPNQTKAYACYPAPYNKISRINTGTNATLQDVFDPSTLLNNPVAMAVSPNGTAAYPNGNLAYICNAGNNTISILNTTTDIITGIIGTSITNPVAIDFTPDGTRAYVASYTGGTNYCTMITVATGVVTGPITVASTSIYGNASDIVVSPDGNFAYEVIKGNTTGAVYIIDTNPNSLTYNTVVGSINDSQYPFGGSFAMAIAPNGLKAYVVEQGYIGSGDLLVVDLNPVSGTYRQVIRAVNAAFNLPQSVAFTADGSKAYVPDYIDSTHGNIVIISVASDSENTIISGYTDPQYAAFLGTALAVPTANPESVSVATGSSANPIQLSGTPQIAGNTLTFALVPGTGPSHGTLPSFNTATGAAAYTPAGAYSGQDSFEFTVKDTTSGITSAPAKVSISVTAFTPPVANPKTIYVGENSAPYSFAITGSSGASGYLIFSAVSQPSHGTISGLPSGQVTESGGTATYSVSYTPAPNYSGSDSFSFKVSDGATSSSSATVTIYVDSPVANSQSVSFRVGHQANAITLTGSDLQSGALQFAQVVGPNHGTVSGLPSGLINPVSGIASHAVTYTTTLPTFSGVDSFQFIVSNLTTQIASDPATVFINVSDTLQANPTGAIVVQNVPTALTLTGSAPGGGALTFAISSGPLYGTLSGFNPATGAVTYTSQSSFTGVDSFEFTVTNGLGTSAPAQVSLDVTFPNARAYVTDYPNSMSTVDILNILGASFGGSVTGQNPLNNAATDLEISTNGSKAYVCYYEQNLISVISTATNKTLRDVYDPSGYLNGVYAMAISQDGTFGYVVNQDTISILDVATDTIVGNVNLNGYFVRDGFIIAFSPDNTRAYLLSDDGTNKLVSMIDVATNTVVAQFSTAALSQTILWDLALSPEGDFGYVITQSNSSSGIGAVYIFDTNQTSASYNTFIGSVVDRSNTFNQPAAMAITPNGLQGYVVNEGNNSVSVVDLDPTSASYQTVTGLVADLSPVTFNNPYNIACTSDGSKAYVVNYTGNSVSSIDVASNAVTSSISGYVQPTWVAFLATAPTLQINTFVADLIAKYSGI